MVEFLPKNGSKHCDLAPLFNTEIYPFRQKYCDILAKSFNNGLYGNIFKKSCQGNYDYKHNISFLSITLHDNFLPHKQRYRLVLHLYKYTHYHFLGQLPKDID